MRLICAVMLAFALALGGAPAVADSGAPPVPLPDAPTGLTPSVPLPEAVDPVSPYLPQVACNPVDMVGPTMLRDLLLKTYGVGRAGGIARGCTEGLSEHSEGRALDWMVDVRRPAERAAAADFLAWVTRDDGLNARRLGIMYVIYDRKIWSVYNARAGWRRSAGHTDHMHVSFSWNGARGATSFWTGAVAPIDFGPCVRFKGSYAPMTSTARATRCGSPPSALVRTTRGSRAYGSRGSTVKRAQALLGVSATGRFDGATRSAVRSYQRAHDLPVTGAMDQPTWASLDRKSIKKRTVSGFNRSSAARYGVVHLAGRTIARGSAGSDVLILQTALALPRRDRNGYVGAVTLAAVTALERRAGLPVDGVVGGDEWQAIRAGLG